MNAPQKITLEKLRADMKVFLDFPDVESSLRRETENTVARIMLSKARNGGRPPLDVMTDYLDAGKDTETRLKFIIGLSGGSLERMKRVYAAMFPGTGWGGIRNDEKIRRETAKFLIDPESAKTFIPAFVRGGFILPENWIQLLRDESYLRAVAYNIAQSKYAVRMGNALEQSARDAVSACGCESTKGAVDVVDNKEVDLVVPNFDEPRVLVMSSYQLTTASSQTARANEQAGMYQAVQTYNRSRRRRGRQKILFINIIDGGGWLDRAADLEAMWEGCDYCFAHAGLRGLKNVLRHQMGG